MSMKAHAASDSETKERKTRRHEPLRTPPVQSPSWRLLDIPNPPAHAHARRCAFNDAVRHKLLEPLAHIAFRVE